jgi:RHS repeat-associated protein
MDNQTETSKRYRYTGKERDEETGLYYHGARYYATWLGRWTSCDPIGIGDGLNIFAYGLNSPVILVDPEGTQTKTIQENREKGLQAADTLKEVVEQKNHGVRQEVTAKGGKGGSRIDIAPDPKAPQTIAKTLESKYRDLNSYRDAEGNLNISKVRRTITEDIAQVQKHQAALREGRKPDTPFRESLVYTLENAKPGEAEVFQAIFREMATPVGIKGGVLQLEKGVVKTTSGRALMTGAKPTPGNALFILANPEFIDEFVGAATGSNLEARAKHSDVFHMTSKQREQLRKERAQKAAEQDFEAEVQSTALSQDIDEEEAEAIVRKKREAIRADVDETKKATGGPVLSEPYHMPPEKSQWERFKAWVKRKLQ